ncbi:MAG: YebC/PmpR family DNA-binding transcriptional regulator [Pseudomonadota bacterium]
MKIEIQEAGLSRIPLTAKKLDSSGFAKFMKLLEVFEDDDDVQKVYHNVEFDEKLISG